jgi:hypothetical protein
MQYTTKTYIEVLEIVRSYLTQIDNVKAFCQKNNIDYYITCKIKKGTDKKFYPNHLAKILKIMNYNVTYEKKHLFKINNKTFAKTK